MEEVLLLIGKKGLWGFKYADCRPGLECKWYHGTADGLAGIDAARSTASHLEECGGVDVCFEEVEGGTHNGILFTHATASLLSQARALAECS